MFNMDTAIVGPTVFLMNSVTNLELKPERQLRGPTVVKPLMCGTLAPCHCEKG